MANPTSRATLIDYCKRRLGEPVIEVNVDVDQIEDRIDEAIQYYQEYHSDATVRGYLKHQITQAEIDRAATNTSVTATDTVDNSITATWLEGKGFIPIPDSVLSDVKVFFGFLNAKLTS